MARGGGRSGGFCALSRISFIETLESESGKELRASFYNLGLKLREDTQWRRDAGEDGVFP
jgi:hypothetical protein